MATKQPKALEKPVPRKQSAVKRGNGRGSITTYKGDRFRWRFRDAFGNALASGITGTRIEAEDALTKAKADNIRGILASPDQITLEQYAAKWLERQDVREITRTTYRREIGLILPALGKKRLKDLKPMTIRDALTKLASTTRKRKKGDKIIDTGKLTSSRTLAHVRTRLRSIFREAVTDQILYVSPAESVKPIKKNRTEQPHISLDFDQAAFFIELSTIMYQASVCRLWAAAFIAISIGLRKSEVMGLRWKDIDFKNGKLLVRHTAVSHSGEVTRAEITKTDHSRRDILMTESVVAVLKMHQQRQLEEQAKAEDAWQDSGAIFTTKIGAWTHPDNLKNAIEDICKWSNLNHYTTLDPRGVKRGHRMFPIEYRSSLEALLADNKPLPHVTPHDLRHTAGTLMLRRKVPVEVVSKTLGHSDIAITYSRYRHVLESEKREYVIDLFPTPIFLQIDPKALRN